MLPVYEVIVQVRLYVAQHKSMGWVGSNKTYPGHSMRLLELLLLSPSVAFQSHSE